MQCKGGKGLIAGLLLLFVAVLLPAVDSSAAAFSLVKSVSKKPVPEGQMIRTSKGRRYQRTNGKFLKNRWICLNGRIYHLNKEGYLDTGWITVRGEQYYIRANGTLHKGGFLTIKGKRYFFKYSYGKMMTGWRKIGKNEYYFQEEGDVGVMGRNQWAHDRFAGADGKMLKETWIGDFYVGADGVRVKNAWVGEKYLGENGLPLTNIWKDGFYLNEEGVIARDTWVGGVYVGSDGKVTEPPAVSQEKKRIFVGDSRTVGMYQIMTGDTLVKATATQRVKKQLKNGRQDIYIGKVSMGYDWLVSTAVEELREVLGEYPSSKVIFRFGVNDLGNIGNYISFYRSLMAEFPDASFYLESVTPVNEKLARQYGYTVTNKMIKGFNQQLQSAFPENYVNSYKYLIQKKGKTVDGIHYTPDTYRMTYDYLDSVLK